MKEKHHIIIAFSIALAIAAALVIYLLQELKQSRANERHLDATMNQQHRIPSGGSSTNINNTTPN